MRLTDPSAGRTLWLAAACVVAISAAACGGGGGGAVTPPSSQYPTAAPSGTGTLSFAIKPGGTPQSLTIALKGQSAPSATVNLSGCSGSCAASLTAPAGNDTFVVTAFDGANGTGNQLSQAFVPQTVTAGSSARVALATSGTVTSVAAVLGTSSVPVGNAATVSVFVEAFDANGNQIVSGRYSTPVTVSLSDANGATSLSATQVTGPGVPIDLVYNGYSFESATVTPMLGTTPGTPATLAGTGSTYTNYFPPGGGGEVGSLAVGPDGNVWFNSYSPAPNPSGSPSGNAADVIGSFSVNGAVRTFASNPNGGGYIYGFVAQDGKMWFGDQGGNVGSIDASGSETLDTNFTGPCGPPTACGIISGMAAAPDGRYVWFTDGAGYIGSIDTQSGLIQEFSIATLDGLVRTNGPAPYGIAISGNDAYVTDDENSVVDQVAISGGIATSATAVVYPNGSNDGSDAVAISADGNVWVGDVDGNLYRYVPSNFTSGGVLSYSGGPAEILQLVAGPDMLFAVNDYDDAVWEFFGLPPASSSTPPTTGQIPAFATAAGAYLDVLALGPNNTLWTATDNTGQSQPIFSRIIYGSPTAYVPPQSLHRMVPGVSHRRTPRRNVRSFRKVST